MAKWIALTEKNELPNVTKADAGEVLTVNAEGKWEAAPPATQTTVTPNPELAGTETKLNGLEVNGTKYSVSDVVANAPNATQELGTLRVGDTVYSIPKGMQVIEIANNTTGTLTDANIATLQNNYPNVCIKQSDTRVLFPRGQGTNAYYFTALDSPSSNSFTIVDMVIYTSTKQYYVTLTTHKGLPTVTSADSGKFLTVNSSGQWVATTVPNAETTSF